jgi:hypothetical protein
MRRALFAREFRSALVPNLVTVGAILATLVLLERLYGIRLGKAEDVRFFTDVALLIGLVVSGFISGERCFPSEVKESRMLFLSSLPIPRSWAWLMIVSGRLLAALASLGLVFVIRRPLVTFLNSASPGEWDLSLVASRVLFAYLFFFSAGALFALLFRRTLFSYVVGFIIVGILLAETALSVAYSVGLPKLEDLSTSYIVFFAGPSLLRIAAPLSLFLAMSLCLSCQFFVRGEIASPKRRIRNQMLLGVLTTAFLGFVFCVESSTTLASVRSTWTRAIPMSQVGQVLLDRVSQDGRYLSVVEVLQGRPFIRRITMIETGSGHVVGRSVYAGAGWFFWSSHGDVLNLLTLNNSPLDRWGYLVPGTADWIRLSPEAREISKLRLKGIEDAKTLAEGRALAVLRQGTQGRVLLLDGTSGRSSELARAPLDGRAVIRGGVPTALVYFNNTLSPQRAWIVDSLAHEVRIPRPVWEPAYILFGEAFGSQSEARAILLRKFGSPSTSDGESIKGELLLSAPDQFFDLTSKLESKGLYFLEKDSDDSRGIWVRPTTSEGRWERLPGVASTHVMRFTSAFVDFPSRIGAFLSAEGRGSFLVYDPRAGVVRGTGNCAQSDKAFLTANRVPGLNGFLIGLTCTDNSSSSHGQTYYFQHIPGSREVRAIKTGAIQPVFSHLYFDEKGTDVWTTFEGGTIWISIPGKKDLRLWPLENPP